MTDVSVADAKARFSEIIERVIAGDTVRITRRGKVVAQITGAQQPRKPIDFDAIEAFRNSLTPQTEGAGEFMRRLRDDARY